MSDLFTILSQCYNIYSSIKKTLVNVKANKKQCITLEGRINGILSVCKPFAERESSVKRETLQLFMKFQANIEECLAFIQQFHDIRWYKAVFNHNTNSEKFKELNQTLSVLASDFNLGINIEIMFNQKQDSDDISEDLADISNRQGEILELMKNNEQAAGNRHTDMVEYMGNRFLSMQYHFKSTLAKSKEAQSTASRDKALRVSETPTSFNSLLNIPFYDLELISKLGSGGSGDVYYAKWISRDDNVAVKILRSGSFTEEIQTQFIQELQYMSSLRYEQIVSILGYTMEPNNNCMIMEYMPKGSLFSNLQNKSIQIDWPMKWSLALQMAKSINFLHLLKPPMLHRDLKSLNFLVDDSFRVKVCDFGLAQVKTHSNMGTVASPSGNIVYGTLRWTAPERLKQFAPYTAACDIYSLGICFWELATREIPYSDASDEEIRQNVISGVRLPISDEVPTAFKLLIQSCWSNDPNQRPSSHEIVKMINKQTGVIPSSPRSESFGSEKFNTPKTNNPLQKMLVNESFALEITEEDVQGIDDSKAPQIPLKKGNKKPTNSVKNESDKGIRNDKKICCCILTRCRKLTILFLVLVIAVAVPLYFVKFK